MLITLAVLTLGIGACSKKNDDNGTPDQGGQYVLSVLPIATTGVADYLLASPSLDTGVVSTAGNGVEQDGSYRYYVTHNNIFFSMLYGQGNPGAVTAYDLDNGKLRKLTNFQSETVAAFAPAGDDILMYKISRNLNTENSHWYRVSTNSLEIVAQGQTNTKTLAGNGELAYFSWLKQVGNKVYAPYFCVTGSGFLTKYPDQAWIAVFSYPEMQVEKVIKDDRTSFVGRYFTDGLAVDEQQDVYAFSSAVARDTVGISDGKPVLGFTSTKPSAITRIKAGTTEFDRSYFFNVEEATSGYTITNWIYIGNGKVIGQFVSAAEKATAYVDGKRLAVVDLHNKTIKWVSGMPAVDEISLVTDNNYTPKDGRTAYFGITFTDGSSYVYKVDAITATATRGLKVEGGTITAISHLN